MIERAVRGWALVESNLGNFAVAGTEHVISRILLPADLDSSMVAQIREAAATPLITRAARQIAEFLSGQRATFDLPVAVLRAEGFRSKVWAVIDTIPFGETLTYGEVAIEAGSPGAARAVGTACGANPIPLLRPCHRVVAAPGIGGYGGGVELKAALLALEQA